MTEVGSEKAVYCCLNCRGPPSIECPDCKQAYYCSENCRILHFNKRHNSECTTIFKKAPFVITKPQPTQKADDIFTYWGNRKNGLPDGVGTYTGSLYYPYSLYVLNKMPQCFHVLSHLHLHLLFYFSFV